MHGRTLLQGHVARIDPPTNGDFSEHGTVDLASNTKEKKPRLFSAIFLRTCFGAPNNEQRSMDSFYWQCPIVAGHLLGSTAASCIIGQ
jgi:hypothetical protein